MSRNLGSTSCHNCGADVVLVESPREITEKNYGGYTQYVGMLVADAECPVCLASYLAWVRPPPGKESGFNCEHRYGMTETRPFFDLSYRHSFNDEPDERDLPRYEVSFTEEVGTEYRRFYTRTGLFKGENLGVYAELGQLCDRCNAHVLRPASCYMIKDETLLAKKEGVCRACDIEPLWKAAQEKAAVAEKRAALLQTARFSVGLTGCAKALSAETRILLLDLIDAELQKDAE